jgi:hypothetical protein
MQTISSTKVENGVMVIKDGLAWGIIYQDGELTRRGWMPPTDARMSDPEFCTKPSDVSYSGSLDLPEINKGGVTKVRRTTTIQVELLED